MIYSAGLHGRLHRLMVKGKGSRVPVQINGKSYEVDFSAADGSLLRLLRRLRGKVRLVDREYREGQEDREKDAFFHESGARRDGRMRRVGAGVGQTERNVIDPGARERMAPRKPPDREPQPATRAVRFNGLRRVNRTRRLEATRAAGERRQQQLIRADDDQSNSLGIVHFFVRNRRRAASKSA